MTNNKRMRKAILRKAMFSSVISLILCCAMLIGTTFAWFTDSVTSANNIIQSGNLDIELEYATFNADGSFKAWKDVKDASDILTNTLYEPGVSQVAYLKVKNAGSLALKYQLGINIVSETDGVNKAGDTFKLSDHIEFGVIEGRNGEFSAYENRDDAVKAVTNAKKLNAGFSKENILYPVGNNTGASEEYLALVVYMPNTVDNVANHNGTAPEINLGINVFATQKDYENDSFGNDYDVNSPMKPADSWDGTTNADLSAGTNVTEKLLTISTAEELATFAQAVNAGNAYKGWTIELAGNIDLSNKPWTPIGTDFNKPFSGTFDGKGYTVYNLNASGSKNIGLFGYAKDGGNIKNLNIENAVISANDYAGAVIGRGYTKVVNCHVKNATVTVTPYLMADNTTYDGGAKAGAVIGQILEGSTIGIEGCTATKVYIKGYRDLGGVVGMVSSSSSYAKNCSATDVTIEYVKLTGNYDKGTPNQNAGAVYGRKESDSIVDVTDEANSKFTLINVVYVDSAEKLQQAINSAAAGETIVLTNDIEADVELKSGITIDGNDYALNSINLKGADNVTLKNIKFDAKNAKTAYAGNGEERFNAIILSGDASKNIKGSRNLVIDGCTFTGTYTNGGTTIAFNDQGRSEGQSGNITIKNCTFETTSGYVDIYTYYSGYGEFVIENNTFKSTVVDRPIYLGRYQSSTPVVVKGNKFEKVDTFANAALIQAHSGAYTVSFDASDNTFASTNP